MLLTVEARDNNNAPPTQQRRIQRNMEIRLLDVNDNHPEFDRPLYEASILENAVEGDSVTTVTATDRDEGINAEIGYTLDMDKGNATHLFDVHPDSGEVFVKLALKGSIGVFHAVVVATDKGMPPLSNTTIVQIHVMDINDYPPVIVYPPENVTIYIMEVHTKRRNNENLYRKNNYLPTLSYKIIHSPNIFL